jgi:hypothetical protein
MTECRVEWVIDLDGDDPLEIAQEALRIHRDPESIATIFTVSDGEREITLDAVNGEVLSGDWDQPDGANPGPSIDELVEKFEPVYDRWRHGGWYVVNVQYPSGGCGCVSRNYEDRKWRIVCSDAYPGSPNDRTFPNRDAAARAEYRLTLEQAEAIRGTGEHRHEFAGQTLTHIHQALGDHGYYGHPEDVGPTSASCPHVSGIGGRCVSCGEPWPAPAVCAHESRTREGRCRSCGQLRDVP